MEFNLKIDNESYKNLEAISIDFEKINAIYQQQKREASNKFRIAFDSFMQDFFELVPSVKRVEWTQYTPYFSDGDTCTFGVNEPAFFNYLKEDTENEDDEDEDEYNEDIIKSHWKIQSWELRNFAKYGLTQEQEKIVQFLNNLISNNEDFLEELFGDHAKITVTAQGLEESECEHD